MNVFGERQHPEKFIPMCIKKIRDGDIVTIHSDKSKKIPGSRHYIHANDVEKVFLKNLTMILIINAKHRVKIMLIISRHL